ncbi:hypothetical protein, partial [Campylobacter coli]
KVTGLIIYLKPDTVYNDLVEKRDLATDEKEKDQIRLAIKKHQDKQKVITKQSLDTIKSIVRNYEKNKDT